MYFVPFLFIATLIGYAQAQTPKGFTPSVNTKLKVLFNDTSVKTPGQLLTKAETASQPQIAFDSTKLCSNETYMFVMLDLDVPPAQGNTTRRVLLHALNTGFKATQQPAGGSDTLLVSSSKGPAPYLSPGPPPTDTIPHRYVQLLFKQPEDFSLKASDFADTGARFNFDITSFMSKNGVCAPLAGNFFTVDGRANATAGRTASPTGSVKKNVLRRVRVRQGKHKRHMG
ncbi:PEBP-like protein [Dothidotthia symphoricarpi CBS 119687]|uniref:PEBP-like protein n=1 Tax=Dothidotthia symphoricarpi CBS 119687 TaxID=1392245 RepID=A0A6A6A4I3_9PLEO|nr:PEBP-like protein [Dothidotthia symphoricarpi CBS 119687]KAF2125511.1 PEBP-like protein [Dothidotthia symphoricarpi CBS 119687]